MAHVHNDEDAGVVSWSTHHLPHGTPLRYTVDPADDAAPIRILVGPQERVALEMPVSVAGVLILTLGRAVDECNALRAAAVGAVDGGAEQAGAGA